MRAAQRVLEQRAASAPAPCSQRGHDGAAALVVLVELEVAHDARVEAHRQIGQLDLIEPRRSPAASRLVRPMRCSGERSVAGHGVGAPASPASRRRRRSLVGVGGAGGLAADAGTTPRRTRAAGAARPTRATTSTGAPRMARRPGGALRQRRRPRRATRRQQAAARTRKRRMAPRLACTVGGHNFSPARARRSRAMVEPVFRSRAAASSAAPTTRAGSTGARARGQQGGRALHARRRAPRLLQGGARRHHRQPARRGGRRGGGAAQRRQVRHRRAHRAATSGRSLVGVEVRAEGWYVRKHGTLRARRRPGRSIATARCWRPARGRFLPLDEKQVGALRRRRTTDGDAERARQRRRLDGGDAAARCRGRWPSERSATTPPRPSTSGERTGQRARRSLRPRASIQSRR